MSDRMPNQKLYRNASINPTAVGGYHSLNLVENGQDLASPLKLFSRAKQAINTIYHEFNSFISEIYLFIDCNFK